jgi:glycosyltransferase involved in cell wall biosynthesis
MDRPERQGEIIHKEMGGFGAASEDIQVDIIIAVHNAEDTIEEAVRSAMEQVIPSEWKWWEKGPDDVFDIYYDSVIALEVNVCCYDDASTDGTLSVLRRLSEEYEKTSDWYTNNHRTLDDVKHHRSRGGSTIKTRLLIGAADPGTSSRGAGYARNRAVELRRKTNESATRYIPRVDYQFLCILDADDIMHPTRIAEQSRAMHGIFPDDKRDMTLMGCQFDRLPVDSTQHYSTWANTITDARLYLERYRECTLIQPTWFMSRVLFERLGGYLEAPLPISLEDTYQRPEKRVKVITDAHETDDHYRLIHPSEIGNSFDINNSSSLRLAEDIRFFYAHLRAGGKLHLHRTKVPLVTYRHREGMSQSTNTSRKLLLHLRAKAWEDAVFHGESSTLWKNGFAVWGAGRDGKDFIKALSPEVVSKIVCLVDVDEKKIDLIKYYENPDLLGKGKRIPILHFSVLAKDEKVVVTKFGRIDKKTNGEDNFAQQSNEDVDVDEPASKSGERKIIHDKRDKEHEPIDPKVLRQLPVVVCVAMYRTNGALESNVASIGRIEGNDLWHVI